MKDTDKNARLPISNVTVRETLREMALDMEVALFRHYSTTEAAKILKISVEELDDLRKQGELGYLNVSDNQVGFLGCQLLTYLLDCLVPPGSEPRPRQAPAPQPSKPVVAAELVSVEDAKIILGIGHSKFYDLKNNNEIECVKIGRRTLVKRASLRRFTDLQSD